MRSATLLEKLVFAVAVAEPGEIEAQHGDALGRQRAGDARRGGDVLGAGKAVGEDGISDGIALGALEQPRQQLARLVLKLESFLADP